MSKSDTALTKSDADGDVLNEKLLQQNSSIQEPQKRLRRRGTELDLGVFEAEVRTQELLTSMREDKKELQNLTETERNAVQRLIDEDHPLQDILVWVALPCLKPCRRHLPKCIPKQSQEDATEDFEEEQPEPSVFDLAAGGTFDFVHKAANSAVTEAKEEQASQLLKYQLAAQQLIEKNKDYTHEEMCQALNAVYEEKEEPSISEETKNHDEPMDLNASKDGPASEEPRQKKKKKEIDSNPYLQYGVAIENFFNLEVALIKIFFFISLLSIPQMIILGTYNDNVNQAVGLLDVISFASMGQSNTLCSKAPNMGGTDGVKLFFACDDNYEITDAVFSAGLLGDTGNHHESLYQMATVCYLDEDERRIDFRENVNITAYQDSI